ncbi:glutamate dehydrogenase (NAD(P)+) [Rhizobium mesoamericanum]|nr:glutamate dehydrogenase (NAD(P)+) [Rhizobium mesoamericanum]
MTVAVQGFGNVGFHAAKFLSENDGAKIVCIVERDGYLRNDKGLDVAAVKSHQLETGSILGLSAPTAIPTAPAASK